MNEWIVLAAVVTVLVAVNGVFVAAEFAILSVPRTLLEGRAQAGERWAVRLLTIVSEASRQDRYIAVAQVGITLASLGLGMYGEHMLARLLAPHLAFLAGLQDVAAHGIATTLALAFLTFWHIVAGEMVPKSVALLHPVSTARFVMPIMSFTGMLLLPLVWLLNHAGNRVLRWLGMPVSSHINPTRSTEEIGLLLEESHDEGLLEPVEYSWMKHLIRLGDRTLRQAMVPRVRVVGLPSTATVAEALPLIRSEGYTRYPVLEGDIDHPLGILHVKDVYRLVGEGRGGTPVVDALRLMPLLPASMPLDIALERIRADRVHLVGVIDEHGGVAGIVTVEDIIEEVFGEVRDEYDEGETSPTERLGPTSWRVRGDFLLEDLSDTVGHPVTHPEIETLSGLVFHLLGRPPQEGDVVCQQGVEITVEGIDDLMARSCVVRLERPPGVHSPSSPDVE